MSGDIGHLVGRIAVCALPGTLVKYPRLLVVTSKGSILLTV
jgi:hypothetical protein